MKKTILIPTDFSATSVNAIRYAADLYRHEDCDIYVLHTYYLVGYSTEKLFVPEPSDADYARVRDTAEKNMEKLKVQIRLRDDHPGHTLHFLNEFGPLLDIIKKKVESLDIDLIVMGTRGESENKNIIFGSNAINIMEKIRNCPTLAIPANRFFKKPNEIVFPTSFKTHFKHKELDYLTEIALLTDTPIRILHVSKGSALSKEQLENKKLLESILSKVQFTFHYLIDVPVQTGVRCFVESRESEMIAFINKKHAFFGSIFSKPMVKELGVHIQVPVLALHDLRN